jgi:hypothetical protein
MMAAAAAYIQAPKQFCCSMVENKMIARTSAPAEIKQLKN